MKNFIYLFYLLISLSSLIAEETEKIEAEAKSKQPYALALDKASKENKSVMLLFTGTDWCHPCQELERTVISTKTFTEFAQKNIIFLALNFPNQGLGASPENRALQQKYGVKGYPTMIMTDEKGMPFQKFSFRGQTVEDFIKDVEEAIKRRTSKIKFLSSKDEEEKSKISKEHVSNKVEGENFIFYADLIAYGILQDKELKEDAKITQLTDLFLYSSDTNFTDKLSIELIKLDPEKKWGTTRLFMIKEFDNLLIAQNDEKAYEFYSTNKTKFKGDDISYLYQLGVLAYEKGKPKITIEILQYILTDEDIKKNPDAVKELSGQIEELKKLLNK